MIDLALKFISSRTYFDDPTSIINGLGDVKGSVLKYAGIICAIADSFAGPLAKDADDGGKHVHANVPDLFKLILRLYQQAQDGHQNEVQIICLDCWDSLLQAGVGDLHTAEQLLDAVDR